jgi:tetratricopeptide (TPR) repeat protein
MKKLSQLLNFIGMRFLNADDPKNSLAYLKKGLKFSSDHPEFYAVTLNNMACVYQKLNKPRIAITYVQNAYKIETKLNNSADIADTCSNLCALYTLPLKKVFCLSISPSLHFWT